MFLFTVLALSLKASDKKFEILVQRALQNTQDNKLKDSSDAVLKPGTYKFGDLIVDITRPLTSPTTPEIRGYATDTEYVAIVSDKDFTNDHVMVDPVDQKLYSLEENVVSDEKVRIYTKKELNPLMVFSRIQSHLKTTDTCVYDDKLECAKKIDMNWNDGPIMSPLLANNNLIKAGFGGTASFNIEAFIDISIKSFAFKLNLHADAEVGARLQVQKTINIAKKVIFDKTFNLLNGLTSITILGFSIGLTLEVNPVISLEEIRIEFGKEIDYYKGYKISVDKSYKLTTRGITESKWIVKSSPVSSEFTLKEELTEYFSTITLYVTPKASLDIKLAIELGDDEVTFISVCLNIDVPIKFGLDIKKCSMPYLLGGAGIDISATFKFGGVSVFGWDLADPYETTLNIYHYETGDHCLLDPLLAVKEKDPSYITSGTATEKDNLVGIYYFPESEISYDLWVTITDNTDEAQNIIKSALYNVKVKDNKAVSFSFVNLDKNMDANLKIDRVISGSSENIFNKAVSSIELSYEFIPDYNSFSVSKFPAKHIEAGKMIEYDQSVQALIFKAIPGKSYIPIIFHQDLTFAQENTYFPDYKNGLKQITGILNMDGEKTLKITIKSIKLIEALKRIRIYEDIYSGDAEILTIDTSSLIKGPTYTGKFLKLEKASLFVKPKTNIAIEFFKSKYDSKSSNIDLRENPITGNIEDKVFTTDYGTVVAIFEKVDSSEVGVLYSRPESFIISPIYSLISYEDDDFWNEIPHYHMFSNLKIDIEDKYIDIVEEFVDIPDHYTGFVVLRCPGFTVLSKDSEEVSDGVFIVKISDEIMNHVVSTENIHIPCRRKDQTITETKVEVYGPFKLNSNGKGLCDETATISMENGDYSKIGCVFNDEEYGIVEKSNNELDQSYNRILEVGGVKVLQNFVYRHTSDTSQSLLTVYKNKYVIPNTDSSATFTIEGTKINEWNKNVDISYVDEKYDIKCFQNNIEVTPSSNVFSINPNMPFTFSKYCKTADQPYCIQSMNLKGSSQAQNWFTVLKYPTEDGIIPLDQTIELGEGSKLDLVTNLGDISFSKVSNGIVETSVYSSIAELNVYVSDVDSNTKKVCYKHGTESIPIKRKTLFDDPYKYLIDMGFDVTKENFNPGNVLIDENGCLAVKSYHLNEISKNNVSSLSGISDFISSVKVEGEGEGHIQSHVQSHIQSHISVASLPINNTGGENAEEGDTDGKLGASGIAGIAIGVIIVVAAVIFAIIWFVVLPLKRNNEQSDDSEKMPIEEI